MSQPAMTQNPSIICPKCGGQMRSYERNSVTIEQCAECRGLFLDRGELERLIDAENAFYADRGGRGDRGDRAPDPREAYYDQGRSGHGSGHGSGSSGSSSGRRRGGFLGDLLDFG